LKISGGGVGGAAATPRLADSRKVASTAAAAVGWSSMAAAQGPSLAVTAATAVGGRAGGARVPLGCCAAADIVATPQAVLTARTAAVGGGCGVPTSWATADARGGRI